ncbi:Torsin-1B [Orchesella cincta]|uniref:Torsin-1B n=1 Tax=Orchesella cincta TaxID=48709 RepID=A0A1D2MZ91_ORCCI|nr:Torsin-1B [Orchesella cincta]
MGNCAKRRSLPVVNVNRYVCFFTVTLLVLSLITVAEAGVLDSMVNRAYSMLGYETCEHPNLHNGAVKRLKTALSKELFGQHLAINIMVTALKAHIEDPNPSKALVLSLHGWAGSGKTFTSQHLMNAMYKNGMNSSFVEFFMSSYHFPDAYQAQEYQDLIRRKVRSVVKHCPRALFIFDEVDKMPPGVLDALVPFIHHPGQVLDGYNYKQAIFVFLSNTGANDITRITKEAWQDGKNREELTFKDFEQVLSNEAFNAKAGGLYKSRVIDKVLVDFFIPFLPLERQHVLSCIKVESKRHKMDPSIIDEEAENIADLLTYWPADVKLYSTTGCKKVDSFVKYRMAQINLDKEEPQDEDEIYEEGEEYFKTDL